MRVDITNSEIEKYLESGEREEFAPYIDMDHDELMRFAESKGTECDHWLVRLAEATLMELAIDGCIEISLIDGCIEVRSKGP